MPELLFATGQALSPDEVFEVIGLSDNVPHWEPIWKAKGYDSWEAWRRVHFKPILERNDLNWRFVEVRDPLTEIPLWRGSMTPSWNNWAYVNGLERPPRLKDLVAKNPFVQNHQYIQKIANSFRMGPSFFTLLRTPNGDTHVVEGMHRSCAITIMAHDDKLPLNAPLYAALAYWPENEPPKLGNWEK